VHSELGFTGKGVRVGIIDTGIDYNHPDLGGGFGPGLRVAFGFDFVGDAYDGSNTPIPDPFPDDCDGHGTHVAGIVGANGAVTGVAPGVTFGAYRVFGCEGQAESDVIIIWHIPVIENMAPGRLRHADFEGFDRTPYSH